MCEFVSSGRSDKTLQDREPIFSVRFLCSSSSKHNFTVRLKKVLFLNYYISKILIITFCKCAKNTKTHLIKIETYNKRRYEISTVKLVKKENFYYRNPFESCLIMKN